jgi:hypothetical protein
MQFAELIILGLSFLVIWLVTSFILWLVGRIIWGETAKYTDALLITLIGNIINFILLYLLQYFIEPLLLPLGLIGVILIISIPWLIVLVGYICRRNCCWVNCRCDFNHYWRHLCCLWPPSPCSSWSSTLGKGSKYPPNGCIDELGYNPLKALFL